MDTEPFDNQSCPHEAAVLCEQPNKVPPLEIHCRPLDDHRCKATGQRLAGLSTCFKSSRRPLILIESRMSNTQKGETLWHEIVHLIRKAGNFSQDEESVMEAGKRLAAACPEVIEWAGIVPAGTMAAKQAEAEEIHAARTQAIAQAKAAGIKEVGFLFAPVKPGEKRATTPDGVIQDPEG